MLMPTGSSQRDIGPLRVYISRTVSAVLLLVGGVKKVSVARGKSLCARLVGYLLTISNPHFWFKNRFQYVVKKGLTSEVSDSRSCASFVSACLQRVYEHESGSF